MSLRIYEFFGFDPLDLSATAEGFRKSGQCPFVGGHCIKRFKSGLTSGACCAKPVTTGPVIICPSFWTLRKLASGKEYACAERWTTHSTTAKMYRYSGKVGVRNCGCQIGGKAEDTSWTGFWLSSTKIENLSNLWPLNYRQWTRPAATKLRSGAITPTNQRPRVRLESIGKTSPSGSCPKSYTKATF